MPHILSDLTTPIAEITLNRPDKFNAFNSDTIVELHQTIKKAEQSAKARLILLKANGKHFSAGADLAWMQSNIEKSEAENEQDAKLLADLLHTLAHCPLPIVCQVQGRSFGGALGLIACSDIVIASDVAIFSFSEVKLGIIPATITPYVLRKIGLSRAMQYIISAERFDAEHALQMGLIHHIKPAANLAVECQIFCNSLLKNGPQAMISAKKLLNQLQPISTELINLTARELAKVRTSAEGQEGLKSFLEKRQPQWQEQ